MRNTDGGPESAEPCRRLPALAVTGSLVGIVLWAVAGGLVRLRFGGGSELPSNLPAMVFVLGLAPIVAVGGLIHQVVADRGVLHTWLIGTFGGGLLSVGVGWLAAGSIASRPASGAPWDILVLGLVLTASAAALTFLDVRRSRAKRRTGRHGTRATGLVTRVRLPDDHARPRAEVTVRFVDAQGQARSITWAADGHTPVPGQPIPLVYDPDRPDRTEAILLDP